MVNKNPSLKEKQSKFDIVYKSEEFYYGLEPTPEVKEHIPRLRCQDTIQKVLDIGAGEGRDSIYIARLGFLVTAVDQSHEGQKKLKKVIDTEKLPIQLICADITKLPLPTAAYDTVIAVTLLSHLSEDHLPSVIKKIQNSTKVHGHVLIVDFSTEDPGNCEHPDNASACANSVRYYFSHNELLSYFSGWDIVDYREYMKYDDSHGDPHYHGVVSIFAKKNLYRI